MSISRSKITNFVVNLISVKTCAVSLNRATQQIPIRRCRIRSHINPSSGPSHLNSYWGFQSVLAAAVIVSCLLLTAPTANAQQVRPQWPSLDQQLKESNVRPGTALELLIKENQQFDLLFPSEANDKRIVPPWLRVVWRKAHPELKYSEGDPTGGYPLLLKEIWEWMVTHQDLKPGGPEPPNTGPGTMSPSPGADLRTSGTQIAPRSESNIRVNRRNPNLIIAASNNIQASGRLGVYYSTDGGATWNQTLLPMRAGDIFQADPTVEWTSDGTAWATAIGVISFGPYDLHMLLFKSTDNGATWTFDSLFSGTQSVTDRQMTWTDLSLVSPYRDNMYAIWHNGAPIFMNRRTGSAWQTPLQVSSTETTGTGIGNDVRTNSAGEVFGFWPDTGSRGIYVVKSINGGSSYSSPLMIATTTASFNIGIPAMTSRRAAVYVTAGAYKTACQSYVFAAWPDLSGDTGCTSAGNEPGSSTSSTCKTRIFFSRSTDGGATWSTPVKINNQTSLNDQFAPFMVVDETNGRVAIMYYDTVADTGRLKTDVYYQSSTDFGASFGAAVRVTTAQTDETTAGTNFGNQYGDYNGLSGQAGVFFPSWTDRRNNAREEIWTSPITDTGGTGPDPSILPWGADRVPPAPPWWQTSDIWVDNDADTIVNEPGEPSRGVPNNQLSARITNTGSAAASGYNVVFKFIPYTTSGSAPAELISTVNEPGTLAAGASRVYTVNWDLTDAFIQSHFASMFWTADHFCVQVTIQPSCSASEDVNLTNNFAQNNFSNVPVNLPSTLATFFIYNHLDKAAIASLEVGAAKGWNVRFDRVQDAGHIPLQPKQWLKVTARIEPGANAQPVQTGHPVLVDIVQRLDGTRVGGLTMGLLPASDFPGGGGNPPSPSRWYIGASGGGAFPISSMQNRFKPGFMFSGQIERGLNPNSRVGFQIGYHAFNAKIVEPPISDLRVANVSGYARFLASTGSVRPFGLVGIGGYHYRSGWHFGVQTGGGLEFPITNRFSITTGATFHFVNSNAATGTVRWVDGTVGLMFRIPN